MQGTLRKLALAWSLALFLVLPTLTRAETAVQAWAQRYGWGGARATALVVDGSNNVIVTGYSAPSFATIKYSSAGAPLWTNRYTEGMAEEIDYATAVAVDGSNNVIVTGYSQAGFFPGPANYATVKYSSAGVPLWTNRYFGLGMGDDRPCAVAADGSNNVIVTGYSGSSGSSYDYATIKYSSEGTPLWTNRYHGPGNGSDLAAAMALDFSGNVIVTGWSMGGGTPYDLATIKYSSAGIPLWTNRYPALVHWENQPCALAVDGSNNVIVAGCSLSGSGGNYDYATIKYSSAGALLWTNRYSGPGNGDDYARDVAVDASNNVIVTGWSGTAGSTNYGTIKYSSAGLPLWTNRYGGSGSTNDCACALAVDANDNVIVTGYSTGFGTSYDYATIGYSSAGLPLWTNRYNGPGDDSDYPEAVAVDGNGSVIVTGYSTRSGGPSGFFATVKYVFPLLITSSRLAGGTFEMLVDNLQPGTLVIEASTNFSGWAAVFTNTTPTNTVFYTDPDVGGQPTRFYRAFQFP